MSSDETIREVRVGDRVVMFDGRVLEILNGHEGSLRVHVAQIKLSVKPTRKDRLYVEITAARRNTPRDNFEVMPEERPAFEALMADVQDAAADAGREPF